MDDNLWDDDDVSDSWEELEAGVNNAASSSPFGRTPQPNSPFGNTSQSPFGSRATGQSPFGNANVQSPFGQRSVVPDTDSEDAAPDNSWESQGEDPWGDMDTSSEQEGEEVWGTSDSQAVTQASTVTIGGKTLGYKSVAVILACILLVVAIIFLFFDNIKVSEKSNTQPVARSSGLEQQQQVATQQQQAEQQQSNPVIQSQEQQRDAETQQEPVQSDGMRLKEISEDAGVRFDGEIYEVQGQITGKHMYLNNGQLIYSLSVTFDDGVGRRESQYFCGYSVYEAVSISNKVIVKYQWVSDNVVSIVNLGT